VPLQTKIYCAHHSVLVEDVVVRKSSRRCSNETCSARASFGHRGKSPIYCQSCIPEKLKGKLVNECHNLCQYEGGCDVRPSYGFKKDGVSATIFLLYESCTITTNAGIICALAVPELSGIVTQHILHIIYLRVRADCSTDS
jgi:hypothetical protein